MISFTLRFLFTFVDMGFAAALPDGVVGVAAISFYAPLQAISIAVWVGLSAGFTAALSAAFGRRDEARVVALKRAMLKLLSVVVPVMMLLGAAIWPLAQHLDLEPDLVDAIALYATTVMVGMPLTGFWSIYPDSIVKAHHSTRDTMIAGLASTAANVALNAWFVFGLELGLFGIALATVVSRLVGLGYAGWRAAVLERARRAQPWPEAAGEWKAAVPAILALALPGALTYVLAAIEGAVVNALLTTLPDATTAIASWGVYERMLMLALMPAVATAVAVVPYVARLCPQGETARVRRELWQTARAMAIAALLMTIAMGYAFAAPLVSYFIQDDTAPISDTTLATLRLLPVAALAALPFLILRPVFEGVQQPRAGVRLTVVRYVLLSIPLAVAGRYIAPLAGSSGLLGMVTGLIVGSAVASWLTVRFIRRLLA